MIPYPDLSVLQGSTSRSRGAISKLKPELRLLYEQFTVPSRGGWQPRFSAAQLQEMFSIKPGEENPFVGVAISVSSAAKGADFKIGGAKVYLRFGNIVYADVRVRSLETIAGAASIISVDVAKTASVPPFPKQKNAPRIELPERGAPAVARSDNEFNAHGLTGKGALIGVVDTGNDWKHEDFIRPDGTSRILYIWDQLDDSFAESGGRVGTKPPTLMQGADSLPGTIYTNAQINAALKGSGVVNTMDYNGHGSACAGAAAGNGRATANGVPAGSFAGVAPEADLIIVKAGECGGFGPNYYLGTIWIAQTAAALKRPVVINHSLGRHFSSHTGDEIDELAMDWISGPGKPGIAIVAAAGNEAQFSLHASGRFGPRRPGQADIQSEIIEVVVSAERPEQINLLNGYFDHRDDWGLAIKGVDGFLVDEKGQPIIFYVVKENGEVKTGIRDSSKKPDYFDEYAQLIIKSSQLDEGNFDRVTIPLPPGAYQIVGFGATKNARSGAFDLYLPDYSGASFTIGANKKHMVGSPGNASNVITAGAYEFRASWINQNNAQTFYNLKLGAISDYSNPGGPREGRVYKPEIVAPASFAISSLSQGAGLSSSPCAGRNLASQSGAAAITADRFHIAWNGTSAAAPFTAGVIALMLQKNPNLDAAQIKNILIKTAIKGDQYVGAVPNPEWGYGKINPEAALAATPPRARPLASHKR